MWSLLIFLAIIIAFCIRWYLNEPKNLPPGPKGIPLLGNALPLLEPGKAYAQLQRWFLEYGPIFRIYVCNRLVIVLGDYASIHEALVKQGDAFSGRPAFSEFLPKGIPDNHGLVMSEGDLWKEQRRFALTTLRDFGFGRPILEPSVQDEVEHVLRGLEDTRGEPCDLRKILNNAVSNVICSLVFGRRFDSSSDTFFADTLEKINYRASESQIEFVSPFVVCEWLAKLVSYLPQAQKFKAEGDEMAEYVKEIMIQVQKQYDPSKEPDNYIHAFMKSAGSKAGDYFTNDQLLAAIMDLFLAGTESTAATLRWGLYYMAKHQDIQERCFNELTDVVTNGHLPGLADRSRLPYTEAIQLETQRIATLAPMAAMHKTTMDAKLCGYDIPADAFVVPFLWNVLHGEECYPDPENFDPGRFLDAEGNVKKDSNFIPFSLGKRVCLGESLAKLELFLFFTSMVSKFRFFFPPDQPEPPPKRFMGFTSTPAPYFICAEKRNND